MDVEERARLLAVIESERASKRQYRSRARNAEKKLMAVRAALEHLTTWQTDLAGAINTRHDADGRDR